MHWDYVVILAFLGVVMPLLGRHRVRELLRRRETTRADRLRLYASTIVMQWLLTAVILWRAESYGVTHRDLGLAIPNARLTIIVSAALAGVVMLNQLFALRIAAQIPAKVPDMTVQLGLRIFPQAPVERTVFLFVVLTVAICEEVIYRGFLQHLFGRLFAVGVGVLLSAAFFSVAHLYQAKRGLITTFIVETLFGLVRLWTATLVPCVISHFVADAIAGFAIPRKMRELASRQDAVASSSPPGLIHE